MPGTEGVVRHPVSGVTRPGGTWDPPTFATLQQHTADLGGQQWDWKHHRWSALHLRLGGPGLSAQPQVDNSADETSSPTDALLGLKGTGEHGGSI